MSVMGICKKHGCETMDYNRPFCVQEEIDARDERIQRLEQAIRAHRSQKADDRCIEDDDRLYDALGDGIKCDRRVGDQEAMFRNCQRFIANRCEGGGWRSYVELEEERNALRKAMDSCCQCRWEIINGNRVQTVECHLHACQRHVRLENGDPSGVTLLEYIADRAEAFIDVVRQRDGAEAKVRKLLAAIDSVRLYLVIDHSYVRVTLINAKEECK